METEKLTDLFILPLSRWYIRVDVDDAVLYQHPLKNIPNILSGMTELAAGNTG